MPLLVTLRLLRTSSVFSAGERPGGLFAHLRIKKLQSRTMSAQVRFVIKRFDREPKPRPSRRRLLSAFCAWVTETHAFVRQIMTGHRTHNDDLRRSSVSPCMAPFPRPLQQRMLVAPSFCPPSVHRLRPQGQDGLVPVRPSNLLRAHLITGLCKANRQV